MQLIAARSMVHGPSSALLLTLTFFTHIHSQLLLIHKLQVCIYTLTTLIHSLCCCSHLHQPPTTNPAPSSTSKASESPTLLPGDWNSSTVWTIYIFYSNCILMSLFFLFFKCVYLSNLASGVSSPQFLFY